jgi:hypothetical protein
MKQGPYKVYNFYNIYLKEKKFEYPQGKEN